MAFNIISFIYQQPVHVSMLSQRSLPALRTIFFASHWLLSYITIVKAMDSGERGMNPVVVTIINSWKEHGPSGDQTSNLHVFFSSPLCYQLSYGGLAMKRLITLLYFSVLYHSRKRKNKMQLISTFTFSHNVFSTLSETELIILIAFHISFCKYFQFGYVNSFCSWAKNYRDHSSLC